MTISIELGVPDFLFFTANAIKPINMSAATGTITAIRIILLLSSPSLELFSSSGAREEEGVAEGAVDEEEEGDGEIEEEEDGLTEGIALVEGETVGGMDGVGAAEGDTELEGLLEGVMLGVTEAVEVTLGVGVTDGGGNESKQNCPDISLVGSK